MEGGEWDRQMRGGEAFRRAHDTTPPWDTGRPQAAILEAADAGLIRGRVLDAGCGTGEHALLAASLGLDATGVDVAPAAIAIAEQKAERGLEARFIVGDVLLCFSDRVPGDAGPRRVSADELRASFADGWHVDALEELFIEVAYGPVATVHAWRATILHT